MIKLPSFNIGFNTIAEARSQLSRSLDIIEKALAMAVTLVDIANAVRSGALKLDRLATEHGQLLLDRNGFLVLREFQPGANTGTLNTGAGVFFVKNGALNYLGSAGTLTVVAPS